MTARTGQLVTRAHHAAVVSGLCLALGVGMPLVCVSTAHADEGSTGTITISQTGNHGGSYLAYQLFTADISDTDHATNIAWADDAMRTSVLAFIDKHGYKEWLKQHHSGEAQHDLAQNAAEYIAESIGSSPTDGAAASAEPTSAAGSFAMALAQHLATSPAVPSTTVAANEPFTAREGYWLFVSNTNNATTDSAGTAPLWVPLGGSLKTIEEKTDIPRVDKSVQEDSSGAWSTVADANVGQDIRYRLSGTLPKNFGAFATYHYQFTDTLSAGLTIDLPAGKSLADVIKVAIDGAAVKVDQKNLSASFKDNVLVVEFADLKASTWSSLHITNKSLITVEYPARLVPGCAVGKSGNANHVTLTYSNDPVRQGDGVTSPTPDVRLYSYALKLTKIDEQTGEPLSGAQFTMRVDDKNSDSASSGAFVQKDGSLGAKPHTFTTDSKGSFGVSGIDEGTYVISEIAAPQGYEKLDEDVRVTLTSTLNAKKRALTSLEASASGGAHTLAGTGEADATTKITAVASDTGEVGVQVVNRRWLSLPITGMTGITSEHALGLVLVLAATIGMCVHRYHVSRR